MDHISVITTQNITIDYDVAGVGERIAARIIDFAIFIAIYILFSIIIASVGLVFDQSAMLVLLVVYGILFVFYDLLCETLFNGQSIGKRVLKIKVISLDGYQPSLGQYFLRWLFRFVDFTITAQVGGLICVAISPNKQRIGDLVAGTTLIKTQPRTSLEAIAFRPQEDENYVPIITEVGTLSDDDISLVHEVLHNFNRSGNNMLVYKMATKVQEVMQIKIPDGMNELQFLQQLIKDYNYLTSRSE